MSQPAYSTSFAKRGVNAVRAFSKEYHPIVHSILIGTILARAGSSMSLPFLALYLAKNTDMNPLMIGFVSGAGALAGMVGGFFGGALSDAFGRKRVMMGALYMWGAVFIGFGLASATWVFLALNLLNGLCRSFYEPVSQALMADLTPREKRFRVFSMRYLCINIGVSVGPLLGALFGMMSGRLPFILTGCIYLFYAGSLYLLLKRFGINTIEGDKKEQVSIASAWRVIRKDVIFRWYLAGAVMGGISYSQMSVTLSQYIEVKGLNQGVNLFALLMSVNAVVVVLLQVPLSRWMEKRKPIVSIALGSSMYALGNLGYAAADGRLLFIAAMVVFTLGEILTFPSTNLLIDGLAPEGLRGTYYGAQSFGNLGQFLGPFLGGLMLDIWNGSVLFTLMAGVPVIGTGFYAIGQKLFYQRKKSITNL